MYNCFIARTDSKVVTYPLILISNVIYYYSIHTALTLITLSPVRLEHWFLTRSCSYITYIFRLTNILPNHWQRNLPVGQSWLETSFLGSLSMQKCHNGPFQEPKGYKILLLLFLATDTYLTYLSSSTEKYLALEDGSLADNGSKQINITHDQGVHKQDDQAGMTTTSRYPNLHSSHRLHDKCRDVLTLWQGSPTASYIRTCNPAYQILTKCNRG